MALFAQEFNGLNDLFILELEDLYDAETRLTEALPKMAEAATSSSLKSAFQAHLGQTQNHVRRLEQVLGQLGVEPHRQTCDAMKGLIKEGDTMIKAKGDEQTRDAGLIAAAQKVEHYEIASYGTVRSYAHHLGRDEI
jgi:ferritin-like metal-binding protein YciE